jgi:hypothetical protein
LKSSSGKSLLSDKSDTKSDTKSVKKETPPNNDEVDVEAKSSTSSINFSMTRWDKKSTGSTADLFSSSNSSQSSKKKKQTDESNTNETENQEIEHPSTEKTSKEDVKNEIENSLNELKTISLLEKMEKLESSIIANKDSQKSASSIDNLNQESIIEFKDKSPLIIQVQSDNNVEEPVFNNESLNLKNHPIEEEEEVTIIPLKRNENLSGIFTVSASLFSPRDDEKKDDQPFWQKPHSRYNFNDFSRDAVGRYAGSYHRLPIAIRDSYLVRESEINPHLSHVFDKKDRLSAEDDKEFRELGVFIKNISKSIFNCVENIVSKSDEYNNQESSHYNDSSFKSQVN